MTEQMKANLMNDPLGKTLLGIVLAVMGFVAVTNQDTSHKVAAIEAQIGLIVSERYPRSQAIAELKALAGEVSRLERWMSRISDRQLKVEESLHDVENSAGPNGSH